MTAKTLVVVLFISLAPTTAVGQSGSAYDWQSGNMYSWSPGAGGSVRLRGFNTRTGANWNTTIQPNGDMRGFDSRNGPWRYDHGTGFYQNFATGRTCVGKGYARTCF